MTSLNDLETRIRDLEYQIIECRNSGDHDATPYIQAELQQKEAAYAELRRTAPDYDQIPF